MNNAGGGTMIQPGKWFNKNTGEEVFVRDSVIDGDRMLVLTDKGQLDMKEFSQYIQAEEFEGVPDISKLYGGGPNPSLISMINQGIDREDQIKITPNNTGKNDDKNIILTRGLGENSSIKVVNDNTGIIINNDEKKVENKNYSLIKKVFDKYPIDRTINFEIVEEEWPFKEFNMLVNILDVPIKDICDYIIDNYLDKESLSNKLVDYFKVHIS